MQIVLYQLRNGDNVMIKLPDKNEDQELFRTIRAIQKLSLTKKIVHPAMPSNK